MKKFVKIFILLALVLVLFVSCHECAICGKSKMNTEKKTLLGKEFYVCKDCKNAPEKAWNEVKDGVKNAADEVKAAAEDVKKGVKTAADDVKDGVKSISDDVKSIFNK